MKRCSLCNNIISANGNNLNIGMMFTRTDEHKYYTLCDDCIEKVVRKVKTMGFVGSFVRHQLPKDLFPFLESNVPFLIKSKHGGLRRNE